MRKKQLLAFLLSVALLSGCSQTSDNSKVPKFSYYYEVSQSHSGTGSSKENSSENQPETSHNEEGASETKPSEITEQEYKIILDPINERTVICKGNEITVTGKVSGKIKPTVSIPHSETYLENGSDFIYSATIKANYTGYGNIALLDYANVRIYVNKGNVTFIQDPEIIETNEKAVKNAIDQPLNQVSEYIATNADKTKIAEVLTKITILSNKICLGLKNDYDKLRAISRWVSANIYYDYAAFDAGVPADTLTLDYMLKNSSSVCGGYSNMTSALAAVQGIKVYNVHGSAVSSSMSFGEKEAVYHEWNYAIINGRVIWIDSGWNSYSYRYADGSYVSGDVGVKYFDISAQALAQNHKAKYAEYRDYFAVLEA